MRPQVLAAVGRSAAVLLLNVLGFRVQGLGLYWDNGKENGNYYIIIGCILGL